MTRRGAGLDEFESRAGDAFDWLAVERHASSLLCHLATRWTTGASGASTASWSSRCDPSPARCSTTGHTHDDPTPPADQLLADYGVDAP